MIPIDIEHQKILEGHIRETLKLKKFIESAQESVKRVKATVKKDLGKDIHDGYDLLVKARIQDKSLINLAKEAVEKAKVALENSQALEALDLTEEPVKELDFKDWR